MHEYKSQNLTGNLGLWAVIDSHCLNYSSLFWFAEWILITYCAQFYKISTDFC